MGLIYRITNKVNGKVYIGLTTQGLDRRKSEHLHRSRKGSRKHKLYLAMAKYGEESFLFEPLMTVFRESDLPDIEVDFIREYDSYRRGYNSTPGGDALSPESIEKIRKKMVGRKITWSHKVHASRKRNGTNVVTPEQREKISRSCSQRFLVKHPCGEVEEIHGLRKFCRDHGLANCLMHATLAGRQKQHKGYVLLKRFND